ncbi:MAG: cytochrome c oxidase assembly protein [Casimicrobiaceae bacterium]
MILLLVGLVFWWLSTARVTILPIWAPWDFSWPEFLSLWLATWWYYRGIVSVGMHARPSVGRRIAFFAGMALLYIVLQTRFEYFAQHQFFINRIQHVVMHHLAPFLLVLAWPGATLLRGMPVPVRRIITHPLVVRIIDVLQIPVLAAFLFSGTFFFWLVPSVHFRAMIDPDIYALMNWTMVAEGIVFWALVMDPRPSPPARTSFAVRATLAVVVMFPQIVVGAIVTFDPRDLYTFYDLCGRIYPELGANFDQTVGGLIIWIPPAMMSVLAFMLVLNRLLKAQETNNRSAGHGDDDSPVAATTQ